MLPRKRGKYKIMSLFIIYSPEVYGFGNQTPTKY
jgi:hypothetical protein